MTTQTPDAVREAVARVRKYADMYRERFRAGQYTSVIHGFDLNCPTEAQLLIGDLDAILAALDSRAGKDLTPRERIARVVAWEHFGIAWHHMEKQSHADVLAMVDRMLDSRAGDEGEVKAYRCRGCGWRGSEPIANGHPQNGCDLELMVHDPIATRAPAVDADEVTLLRTALNEIDQIAGTTIPPDGDAAAWSALEAIIKLIHPFRTNGAYPPRTPPSVDAVPAGEVTEAMVDAALNARLSGGTPVLAFLPSGANWTPLPLAREIVRCALSAALSHGEGRKS